MKMSNLATRLMSWCNVFSPDGFSVYDHALEWHFAFINDAFNLTCRVFTRLFTLNTPRYFPDFALINEIGNVKNSPIFYK